jgi:hypothetical protein
MPFSLAARTHMMSVYCGGITNDVVEVEKKVFQVRGDYQKKPTHNIPLLRFRVHFAIVPRSKDGLNMKHCCIYCFKPQAAEPVQKPLASNTTNSGILELGNNEVRV